MAQASKDLINTYCVIPNNTLKGDKHRQNNICQKLNGEIFNDFSIKKYKKKLFSNIFFTDKIKLIDLIKIIFIKKNKVFSNILELNSLSYESFFEESTNIIKNNLFSYKIIFILKIIFFDFIKIFLIKFLINSTDSHTYIPSKLRINFLKNKKINTKFILVKNLPSKNYLNINLQLINEKQKIKFEKIINNKKFFFINGNINNTQDLEKICQFCGKKNYKILISSFQIKEIKLMLEKYPKVIVDIGYIKDNNLLFYIISKSLGGLCLYNNYTTNQIYSSSTKLYEFVIQSKYVIFSDNRGIKAEISELPKNIDRELLCGINEIDKKIFREFDSTSLNTNLFFENFYYDSRFHPK